MKRYLDKPFASPENPFFWYVSKKMPVYETHDNGGRPFSVEIDGTTVSVTKTMNTYKLINGQFHEIAHPPKHLFTVKADEIFIGKKSPKGGYDGLSPKKAIGNSILLRIGSVYRFIGHEIYDFHPVKGDQLHFFYSDIGNNDVPYPYAIGTTHVYFFLDKEAVERSYFNFKENMYDQYYFEHRATMCLKGNPKTDLCKDKEAVKQRIREFHDKRVHLKIKQLVKRGS